MNNEQAKNYLSVDNFYTKVKEDIEKNINSDFNLAIMTIDLDHFNYINDLFGYEVGDLILQTLTNYFLITLNENSIFSRIHADIFAFYIRFKEYPEIAQTFIKLTNWKAALKDILPPHYNLTASGGIVMIQEIASISSLVDKANYARKKAKECLGNSFRFYDEKMDVELQWKKIVTLSMESALINHEFEMYLQPKVLIKNSQIIGAEALARWKNPKYGLIYPDNFISILEQNGFIKQLDFFMLEEACQFLKESLIKGIPQLPISINFSKIHLSSEYLVDHIFQTVKQFNIDTKLIEIEFTESLSIVDFERLIEVASGLKLLGFRVSLDDFGSAYSSLSCLKELPIDIIKLDKAFLNSSTDTEKGKMIITKVIELIKSLRMTPVMEGIETEEQADFLKKLSCDLGQGYFYAKPMTVTDYIEYLKKGDIAFDIQEYFSSEKGNKKSHSQVVPEEFLMDNWELYTLGKNIDMGLMKGYLDGEGTVQYVNDRALEYLGYTRQEFREIFHNSITAFTHPDDVPIVKKNIEQLIKTGKSLKFQTRAIKKDGKVIILQGNSSCIIDEHGRPIGLYAFQDITEELEHTELLQQSLEEKIKELENLVLKEKKAKETLYFSEERYRAIVEQSDDIMFDWDFITDTIFISSKYVEIFGEVPIIEKLTTNSGIRSRIHPSDLEIFEQWISNTYKKNICSISEFRIKAANGEYIWIKSRSTAICDENGNPLRAVGLFLNINSQKNEFDILTFKSQRDPLTKLLNKEETRIQIEKILEIFPNEVGSFYIIDIDNFKELNDNLGHQLGDTVLIEFTHKIRDFFPSNSIVGRIGGDEIAAYMPYISLDNTASKAEQLLQALRMNYYGSASKYNIHGSVGIAAYPMHGKTFDELYHLADIALYESKRRGKDCYTIYKSHMTGSLQDNRTPVEWSESFLNTYFQGDFSFKIFEILYETKDINASIQMVLELLGKRFKVERVYIFQNDSEGKSARKIYEWCTSSIEKGQFQNIVYKELGMYLSQYTKEGIFCCPDVRYSNREVYEICRAQNIKSLLHCAIYNEKIMTGFIGFDMCTKYHNWSGEEIAILGYISRILSVFMVKFNTTLKLETSYQNYVEMLENLNGYVYVVDLKTYKILYVNNSIKKLGLDYSQTCYKMTFNIDTPCKKCPIDKLSDKVPYATEEIYSEALHGWVNSAASKLKWEQNRDAVLICCTDISKYK